ncbi:MAG: hypothetical protein ACREX4_24025 [Gammaproteobacteria bacterium]
MMVFRVRSTHHSGCDEQRTFILDGAHGAPYRLVKGFMKHQRSLQGWRSLSLSDAHPTYRLYSPYG